jgi:aryl-alcohol dehydrogenase-like predicted oxidoreductase
LTTVPLIEFRPGYIVPKLIRGGWQLSGDHGSVVRARAIEDVVAFVDAGMTCFDCADIYTGVEEIYGEALHKLADARGQSEADKVRIHTKYVPDRTALANLKIADTRQIITRSLSRLRREQIDLVQFHWWDYDAPGMEDTVAHLATLQTEGLIKHIGITNFGQAKMEAIAGIVDLVSAQVQFSILDRRPTRGFATSAHDRNVHLICYGVLAGGFLTDFWLDQKDPGFEFENRSLVKYRLIIEEFGGWQAFQELLTVLRAIADEHDADIAAVAARAMLEDPAASALIIGARYARHLPRLKKALDFALTAENHRAISDLQARANGPTGDVYALERDANGIHGRIMKYNLNAGETA